MRILYSLHRWLGIAAGLMLVIWYGSGLYVHWRALPSVLTSEEQHRAAGSPLKLSDPAIDFGGILQAYGHRPCKEIRLRRAGSRLVYEIRPVTGRGEIIDAQTGTTLSPIDPPLAEEIAQGFAPGVAIGASTLLQEPDTYSSRLQMPVYRVGFSDDQRTAVYIDPNTGSILARARTRERMYYLFGSIPHFLNFNVPAFRKNDALRNGLLFTLNAMVGMIVLSGMAVGIGLIVRQGFLGGLGTKHIVLRTLHYLFGLGFAVTTLLFIVSGFFYVSNGSPPPARVLPKSDELARVVHPLAMGSARMLSATWKEVAGNNAAADFRLVVLKQILDVPVYQFHPANGPSFALRGDTGTPLIIDEPWLHRVAETFLGRPATAGDVRYLRDYDDYYYARDGRIPALPVYRFRDNDPGGTMLYLSAVTGEVLGSAPPDFQAFRWLITGFHAWDWPFLLHRPVLRDTVIVFLVVGGLIFSLSGLYLGFLYLTKRSESARGNGNLVAQEESHGDSNISNRSGR